MSLKARIIDSVAMVAVALIALKLMTTVHLPPSVSAPLSTLAHVLFAAMALIWILSAFINAEQEAGGEKRPAFLAAGATLAAILSLLIRSRVEFQTAPQAYGAFGMSAAMLLLAGVCFWQLQSAVRRGMPKTARSYMAAAFLPLIPAVGIMLKYVEIALTPFPHTAFEIALYAPIAVGYFWMSHRLGQIVDAQERMSEQEHAK